MPCHQLQRDGRAPRMPGDDGPVESELLHGEHRIVEQLVHRETVGSSWRSRRSPCEAVPTLIERNDPAAAQVVRDATPVVGVGTQPM